MFCPKKNNHIVVVAIYAFSIFHSVYQLSGAIHRYSSFHSLRHSFLIVWPDFDSYQSTQGIVVLEFIFTRWLLFFLLKKTIFIFEFPLGYHPQFVRWQLPGRGGDLTTKDYPPPKPTKRTSNSLIRITSTEVVLLCARWAPTLCCPLGPWRSFLGRGREREVVECQEQTMA